MTETYWVAKSAKRLTSDKGYQALLFCLIQYDKIITGLRIHFYFIFKHVILKVCNLGRNLIT